MRKFIKEELEKAQDSAHNFNLQDQQALYGKPQPCIRIIDAFNVCLEAIDKDRANRAETLVRQGRSLPDVACGNCGNCSFWKRLGSDTDTILYGACKYETKFPDSRFARSAGQRKNMRENDGRNCPCYESKPSA